LRNVNWSDNRNPIELKYWNFVKAFWASIASLNLSIMKVSKPLVLLPIIIIFIINIINSTEFYRASNIKGIEDDTFCVIHIHSNSTHTPQFIIPSRLSDYLVSTFVFCDYTHHDWFHFDMVSHCIIAINSNESIKGVYDILSVLLMKHWDFWVDIFIVEQRRAHALIKLSIFMEDSIYFGFISFLYCDYFLAESEQNFFSKNFRERLSFFVQACITN